MWCRVHFAAPLLPAVRRRVSSRAPERRRLSPGIFLSCPSTSGCVFRTRITQRERSAGESPPPERFLYAARTRRIRHRRRRVPGGTPAHRYEVSAIHLTRRYRRPSEAARRAEHGGVALRLGERAGRGSDSVTVAVRSDAFRRSRTSCDTCLAVMSRLHARRERVAFTFVSADALQVLPLARGDGRVGLGRSAPAASDKEGSRRHLAFDRRIEIRVEIGRSESLAPRTNVPGLRIAGNRPPWRDSLLDPRYRRGRLFVRK